MATENPVTKRNSFWDTVSLVRLFKAFLWSLAGLATAFRTEASFRLEVILSLVLIPLGITFGQSGSERALLVSSVMLVLVVELINTAVETLVERISPEWHTLSGRAKDIGSASVLISTLIALIVWTLILWK